MNLKIRLPSSTRAAALLALALALFALAAGCNKAANTGNSPESASSNNAPANTSSTANTAPSTTNTSASTAKPAGLSPMQTVKGYYEAGVRKDTESVKRFLSRASLQLMEEIAKSKGKTLDQLFSEAADMDIRKRPPIFSNERIRGDSASVDIETPGNPLVTMPLVKEDGEWKLAFGKPKRGAIKR